MQVARDGRGTLGSERPVGKGNLAEAERTPPEIDQTQPMERSGPLTQLELDETSYIGAPLARIEQLPQGILVEETAMGRATGQWIVQIRCDCGRRWFDVEMIKTARCPRCDSMVLIEPID